MKRAALGQTIYHTHASFLLIHKTFANSFKVREIRHQENYCRTYVVKSLFF